MPYRTHVYIDGFNLYYRALKPKPRYRWLDVLTLCQSVLIDDNRIERIRYFTADVSGKGDPGAPKRQKIYLDALRTIPILSIHKGNFLTTVTSMRLAAPPHTRVKVLKSEEKGSDVNLACHMLVDGFRDHYDVAVVVSNDSDLAEPIRLVREELKKPVGLICPCDKVAYGLQKVATFTRHITPQRLRDSQFPDPITGTSLRRPIEW